MKLKDKLWNEANLEGSHNQWLGINSTMTPEEFAKEYNVPNAFVVPFKGNIVPPFDEKADRFSVLRETKWSIIGDSSSELPEDEYGYTDEIIKISKTHPNVTGAEIDDFFLLPEWRERITPQLMKNIRKKLNDNGLAFWSVFYEREFDIDISEYLDCFDGFSFWVWDTQKIKNLDEYLNKFFEITKGKKTMLGIYLWDFAISSPNQENNYHPIDPVLFEKQLKVYFDLLIQKKTEGIIICANTVGDIDTEANKILKKYIEKYGDIEIE